MIKKVLVIGGTGFLGQSIFNHLIDFQYSDYIFYQGFYSNVSTISNSYYINILDSNSVESAVRNFDVIINCSGQNTNPINICYQQNTIGIKHLISAIKKFKKFLIHISSAVVYGSANNPSETDPLNFETPYAACKSFSEFFIKNEITEEDFLILRIANLYGENQTKGLFAYLKKSFETNHILEFNNNGNLLL